MQFKASVKLVRQSPRKVRKIANLVRGLDVEEAAIQLRYLPQRSSVTLLKLVDSAAANALNNFEAARDNLFIKTLTVNEGPRLKRYQPRAHGRAYQILKRTSSIEIVLEEKEPTKKKVKKAPAQPDETISIADLAKKDAEKAEKDREDQNQPGGKKGAFSKDASPKAQQQDASKRTIFRRKGDA
ncbi:50S ribosomal protein L22 [Patescibacteria group bacterium]